MEIICRSLSKDRILSYTFSQSTIFPISRTCVWSINFLLSPIIYLLCLTLFCLIYPHLHHYSTPIYLPISPSSIYPGVVVNQTTKYYTPCVWGRWPDVPAVELDVVCWHTIKEIWSRLCFVGFQLIMMMMIILRINIVNNSIYNLV